MEGVRMEEKTTMTWATQATGPVTVAWAEVRLVAHLAVTPAMQARGVSRHLITEGDFYTLVSRTDDGIWSVRVADAHGGDDFARVDGSSLYIAITAAIRAIGGAS